MTPSEMRLLTDQDLVGMLTSLRTSDAAVAWLAALLAEPTALEGVSELRRRYQGAVEPPRLAAPSGRYVGALSVKIDRRRWNSFWFRRRMPLNAVGPLVNRCAGLGSVIGHKGSAGYYTLDALACELEMRVDDLIFEVGTDEERERLAVAV
ncbi:MAG TPA: hypothetical protein VGK50_02080 [Coriobacteriia bacterium]|jgi:hypothetical protein